MSASPARGRMAGGALATACVADALFGEPPVAHPVRAMGRFLLGAKAWNAAASASPVRRKGAGVLAVAAGVGVSWWAGRRLAAGEGPLRPGLALAGVISLRELVAAGRRVRLHLEGGDLGAARCSLARDLVSRDTSRLSGAEVAGAAMQSLAENLNDAFVAPLLWATVGGGGAAYAYRFVNTADSVLGYRTPELEAFGWAAARSDDLLGWLPARLTAAALVLAAPISGASAGNAVEAIRTSAGTTPSPNGGLPMAALAGALDVRLEKRGSYVLHRSGREASSVDLRRAERLIVAGGCVAVGMLAGAQGIRKRVTGSRAWTG